MGYSGKPDSVASTNGQSTQRLKVFSGAHPIYSVLLTFILATSRCAAGRIRLMLVDDHAVVRQER